MEISSLSHTFRSTGFINPGVFWSKDKKMSTDVDEAFRSLSIDMVEVGDQEVKGTNYLYSHEDGFWTIRPQ